MSRDLRSFISGYEKKYQGAVINIEQKVDARYVPTAIINELEKRKSYPLVIFHRVGNSGIPVVTNVLSSREKLAFALQVEEKELASKYAERMTKSIPPVVLDDPPFKENTICESELDLRKQLPILTHYSSDAGPYITGGLVAARDPDTGVDTCGYHRMQLKGANKLGISFHSRKRMWDYFRRAEEKGRNLEAAVFIGSHPAVSLGSLAIVSHNQGKYEKIGALLGGPLPLAACDTSDIQVPYWSEIVIEGEILAGEREKEGPFAEFTDYNCERSTENVFIAKKIHYRTNPIYQSVTPGMSADHNIIMSVQREGDTLKALNERMPQVKGVRVPFSGCGFFHCYISLEKTAEGQPLQAIIAAFSIDHNFKLVVVVDDDIDLSDEDRVLWSLSTRVQADRDVVILPQKIGMGCVLDPSTDDLNRSSKMGIDATEPLAGFSKRIRMDPRARSRALELLNAYL